MTYEEFWRTLVTPHWCEGSPLRWTTPENVGIARFAEDGKVGLFNLSWWLIGRKEPPPASVYRNTNLMWAIMNAPRIWFNGRSLVDHAAYCTHTQFNNIFLNYESTIRPRIEGSGMQWSTVNMLARKGQSA